VISSPKGVGIGRRLFFSSPGAAASLILSDNRNQRPAVGLMQARPLAAVGQLSNLGGGR
jgi:hypothetical protein